MFKFENTQGQSWHINHNDVRSQLVIGGGSGIDPRNPFRVQLSLDGIEKPDSSGTEVKSLSDAFDICIKNLEDPNENVTGISLTLFHGDHGSITIQVKKDAATSIFKGEITATGYPNQSENEILHEQYSVGRTIQFGLDSFKEMLEHLKGIESHLFATLFSELITSIEQGGDGFVNLNNPFPVRIPLNTEIRSRWDPSFREDLSFKEVANKNERDPLTGFKTQKDFDDPAYRESITGIGGVIFIFADIIGMKYANKYFTPERVNGLIKEVAEVARQIFSDDHCIRTGGDEFLFVLPLNRYNSSIATLTVFRKAVREIGERFYADLTTEEKENAQEAFEIQWSLDQLAGMYRKQKSEELERLKSENARTNETDSLIDDDKAQIAPLNSVLDFSEFIDMLEANYPESKYKLTPEEKWLYAAEQHLEQGNRPSSRILDLYFAPVRVDNVVSSDDPLLAAVYGDRIIQELKSKTTVVDEEKVYVLKRKDLKIRASTESAYQASVLIRKQVASNLKLLDSDSLSAQLFGGYKVMLDKARDPTLEGIVYRKELLQDVPAILALGQSDAQEYTFIKIELPGFGILNGVEGTNRADEFFFNQINKVAPQLGLFFGYREGGTCYLVVPDTLETIQPLLYRMNALMEQASNVGAQHPLIPFGESKRRSVNLYGVKQGEHSFEEFNEVLVKKAYSVELSVGKGIIGPADDLSKIGGDVTYELIKDRRLAVVTLNATHENPAQE